MLGERALGRLAARHRLVHDDVGALAEQLRGALQDALHVRRRQIGVELLARGPALDEGDAARVVRPAVQGVEDAALLAMGGLDERLAWPRAPRPPGPAPR